MRTIATTNRCKQPKNSRHPDEFMGPLVSSLLEAVPTINRSALGRLEGNLALGTAFSAGRLVHLAWSKPSRPTEPWPLAGGPSLPTEPWPLASVLWKAIPAVNRFAFRRLEGYFTLGPAVGAFRLVHLARSEPSRPTEPSTVCHFLTLLFFSDTTRKNSLAVLSRT